MHLSIKNLAKISSAEMDFNGITLIVGANNTGKSTAGRVLYSVFNSMYNFQERIYRERYEACRRALRLLIRPTRRGFVYGDQDGDIISDYLKRTKNDDQIRYAIESLAKFRNEDVDIPQIFSEMEAARRPSDDEIRKRLVRGYFASVFHDQYLSLYNPRKGAIVELTIKSMTTRVMLRKTATVLKRKFEIEAPSSILEGTCSLRGQS